MWYHCLFSSTRSSVCPPQPLRSIANLTESVWNHMVSKMTRGRHAPYAVSPLLATHPRPLRGFPSVLVASLSAFLQHFSRPALSVTIAHPRVARRKPTCPVGARSKQIG